MENASKALIIAGAILLSILLISLGIFIYTQAQDVVNNSGMSKAEVSTFNSQFTKYEGRQKGSAVKSMIQEVNASNISDEQEGSERKIVIEGIVDALAEGQTSYKTTKISSTTLYTVDISEYDASGYVSKITISNSKQQ